MVFAAQMLNFPVNGATSGHLLGGVVAGALLGPWVGILSMAIVLTIQSLLFGDGELAALGANILNMGIVAAGLGGWLFQRLRREGTAGTFGTAAFAGLVSVLAAATIAALEIAFSGSVSASSALGAALPPHALIGIGEAILTACLVAALANASEKQSTVLALAIALLACLVSPLASSLPDGLDSAIATLFGNHLAESPTTAWLAEYSLPLLGSSPLSTVAAALIGLAVTTLVAAALAKATRSVRSI